MGHLVDNKSELLDAILNAETSEDQFIDSCMNEADCFARLYNALEYDRLVSEFNNEENGSAYYQYEALAAFLTSVFKLADQFTGFKNKDAK